MYVDGMQWVDDFVASYKVVEIRSSGDWIPNFTRGLRGLDSGPTAV